eukprot:jgi/Mesen1/7532/ME000391S06771
MSTLALKPIQFLTAEDVQSTGLVEGAGDFVAKLQSAVQYGQSEASIWQYISTHVLEQEHPAKLHKLLYQSAFLDWDVARLGPPPVWIPTLRVVEANAPRAIVLSAVGSSPRVTLREGDLAWDDFLSLGGGGGGGGASDGGYDARVTMLGVVPSMVKAWATSGCMAGLAWSRLRCFSSTGEASSPDDYLWLMCPILEYCGGTEIGGGFLTGSFLQPQALSAFSTPALGCGLVILDQDGRPTEKGEVCTGECALQPFMLGSSSKLLNADHHKVYFKGMPTYKGQRTAGGFYRAHGRVDDTMNLGGIKVSSVEIERVCNQSHEAILETAAIGVAPPGGGPELLLVAAVLKAGRQMSESELLKIFLSAVQSKLNPLFKVSRAAQVPTLPRTASNKVMRRVLRDQFSTLGKQAAAAGGRAPPRAKL